MTRLTVVFALLLCALTWSWAQQAGTSKESRDAQTEHKATETEKRANQQQMGAYTPDKLQSGPAPDVLPSGAQLAVVEAIRPSRVLTRCG